MRSRRRNIQDANQKQIVKELRDCPGVSVYVVGHIINEFDLIVGWRNPQNGQRKNLLVEVKQKGKEEDLTEGEKQMLRYWPGEYCVASSSLEILVALGAEPVFA